MLLELERDTFDFTCLSSTAGPVRHSFNCRNSLNRSTISRHHYSGLCHQRLITLESCRTRDKHTLLLRLDSQCCMNDIWYKRTGTKELQRNEKPICFANTKGHFFPIGNYASKQPTALICHQALLRQYLV